MATANHDAALEKALSLLVGRELAIDPGIGLGYLSQFIHALETGQLAFEGPRATEYITAAGARIYETGDLYAMRDDRLSSIPSGSLVKIHLNDYMSVRRGLCTMGVQDLANNLLFYRDAPNVSGAIIEVNSGGGEAMAGQIMYNAVRDFGKPVVAFVHSAGSAAYLAISGAKEIVASGPLSKLGSIGALVSLDRKFIAAYKERFEDIYSDLSGDKNGAFREYIETGDSTGIKLMLNDTVEAFHGMVEQFRDIKDRKVTLRGGMFGAEEAKRRGLADIIGPESLAIKRLKKYT